MGFEELFLRARQEDKEAMMKIIEMYRPLMIKYALVDGKFDDRSLSGVCISDYWFALRNFLMKKNRPPVWCIGWKKNYIPYYENVEQ